MSHSPALVAMIAVRRAVAPVAQALATLNTGMPVWPICFCSCWPMPAEAFIRLPAASTPTSFTVTPPSASAPSAASEARSTMSLSACLPNLVIVMPRIHMSSEAMFFSYSGRLEPEADGLGAFSVGADRERRELHLHAEGDVLGVGRGVDDVGPHAGAVAVDDRRDERYGHARRGHRHDRERPHLALGGDVRLPEGAAAARGARVAPVEEPGPARRAFVGLQV